jgi:hypothetical protein
VIVPLLAAEAVVGDLRARLDRSAGWGVPAHAVRLRLPIRATVTVARLMQEGATDGRWHTVADYPLGVAVTPG